MLFILLSLVPTFSKLTAYSLNSSEFLDIIPFPLPFGNPGLYSIYGPLVLVSDNLNSVNLSNSFAVISNSQNTSVSSIALKAQSSGAIGVIFISQSYNLWTFTSIKDDPLISVQINITCIGVFKRDGNWLLSQTGKIWITYKYDIIKYDPLSIEPYITGNYSIDKSFMQTVMNLNDKYSLKIEKFQIYFKALQINETGINATTDCLTYYNKGICMRSNGKVSGLQQVNNSMLILKTLDKSVNLTSFFNLTSKLYESCEFDYSLSCISKILNISKIAPDVDIEKYKKYYFYENQASIRIGSSYIYRFDYAESAYCLSLSYPPPNCPLCSPTCTYSSLQSNSCFQGCNSPSCSYQNLNCLTTNACYNFLLIDSHLCNFTEARNDYCTKGCSYIDMKSGLCPLACSGECFSACDSSYCSPQCSYKDLNMGICSDLCTTSCLNHCNHSVTECAAGCSYTDLKKGICNWSCKGPCFENCDNSVYCSPGCKYKDLDQGVCTDKCSDECLDDCNIDCPSHCYDEYNITQICPAGCSKVCCRKKPASNSHLNQYIYYLIPVFVVALYLIFNVIALTIWLIWHRCIKKGSETSINNPASQSFDFINQSPHGKSQGLEDNQTGRKIQPEISAENSNIAPPNQPKDTELNEVNVDPKLRQDILRAMAEKDKNSHMSSAPINSKHQNPEANLNANINPRKILPPQMNLPGPIPSQNQVINGPPPMPLSSNQIVSDQSKIPIPSKDQSKIPIPASQPNNINAPNPVPQIGLHDNPSHPTDILNALGLTNPKNPPAYSLKTLSSNYNSSNNPSNISLPNVQFPPASIPIQVPVLNSTNNPNSVSSNLNIPQSLSQINPPNPEIASKELNSSPMVNDDESILEFNINPQGYLENEPVSDSSNSQILYSRTSNASDLYGNNKISAPQIMKIESETPVSTPILVAPLNTQNIPLIPQSLPNSFQNNPIITGIPMPDPTIFPHQSAHNMPVPRLILPNNSAQNKPSPIPSVSIPIITGNIPPASIPLQPGNSLNPPQDSIPLPQANNLPPQLPSNILIPNPNNLPTPLPGSTPMQIPNNPRPLIQGGNPFPQSYNLPLPGNIPVPQANNLPTPLPTNIPLPQVNNLPTPFPGNILGPQTNNLPPQLPGGTLLPKANNLQPLIPVGHPPLPGNIPVPQANNSPNPLPGNIPTPQANNLSYPLPVGITQPPVSGLPLPSPGNIPLPHTNNLPPPMPGNIPFPQANNFPPPLLQGDNSPLSHPNNTPLPLFDSSRPPASFQSPPANASMLTTNSPLASNNLPAPPGSISTAPGIIPSLAGNNPSTPYNIQLPPGRLPLTPSSLPLPPGSIPTIASNTQVPPGVISVQAGNILPSSNLPENLAHPSQAYPPPPLIDPQSRLNLPPPLLKQNLDSKEIIK